MVDAFNIMVETTRNRNRKPACRYDAKCRQNSIIGGIEGKFRCKYGNRKCESGIMNVNSLNFIIRLFRVSCLLLDTSLVMTPEHYRDVCESPDRLLGDHGC